MNAIKKAAKQLWKTTPLILGTMLLVSLVSTIPKEWYTKAFTQNPVIDSILGAIIGSVSAGNPVTSYIFGGELLKQGIGLVPVTAFLVAWVTVGLVQLPAEMTILGKRFAILRNVTAFLLAIVAALVTVVVIP